MTKARNAEILKMEWLVTIMFQEEKSLTRI